MLRRMCGIRRAPDEPWLDWIIRTTQKPRLLAKRAGIRDWVQAQARQKWFWAGHVARMPATSWAWRTTFWRDSDWTEAMRDESTREKRPSRRRWMKWEDTLRRYATQAGLRQWARAAGNRTEWASHAEFFETFIEG